MTCHIRASLIQSIPAHNGDVNGISLGSNVMATCSSDKTVRLWNMADYTELPSSPLKGHSYHVHCCEFSPFETTLATCSTDGKVILWDMKTFDKLAVLQHPSNQCIRVCKFSSNSCLLATGSDDMTLCLWDVGSRALLKTMEGHETAVVACSFSPDTAYLVSGSKNGDLRVWDARFDQKTCLYLELHGHDLGVTCCVFSSRQIPAITTAHQLLTTSGYDNNVKLWLLKDERSGPKLQIYKVLTGHSGPVLACSISMDGELIASVSGDKTIRLWNPDTGACLSIFEGHTRYITCCAFSPNRQYLATGSNDKTVAIWQLLAPHEHDPGPTMGAPIVDLCDELSENKEWLSWTVKQVCDWLEKIGLGQYKDLMSSQDIDGQELESLTDSSLKNEIGMKALGHRNKLLRAIKNLDRVAPSATAQESTSDTPNEFICPITCEIMTDPVIVADGYTYERAAIKAWLTKGSRLSPMTNSPLHNHNLTPNRSLKLAIQRHLQELM